jgi:hypothetical protein
MIRYSTQPSKDAKVITDSPTSETVTTKDVLGLNDDDKGKNLDLDLDSDDQNN